MRLATFNVLHGRSLVDGRVDGARFAGAVAALDADVLALQEVDRGQPRSGELDLTALAARACGASAYRFCAALVGTPGETYRAALARDGEDARDGDAAHDGGDGAGEPCFGVGLVSRWPVRSWHVTRLARAPVRAPLLVAEPGRRVAWLHDEPRVLLAAVIDGPDGPFTAATTHLSFVPGWNAGQLRRVVRALRRLPSPRVLLGDLNMPVFAAAAVSGWRPLARLATYPAWRPRIQFDHVLLDRRGAAAWPEAWRAAGRGAVTADAPAAPFSDHRPLVVRLMTPGARTDP